VVIAIRPLFHAIGWHGIAWMGAGGLAYTLGIVFFALDRLRYFHAAWHLFVLAAASLTTSLFFSTSFRRAVNSNPTYRFWRLGRLLLVRVPRMR